MYKVLPLVRSRQFTSVMVLDSFERDFYIDLGDMAQSVDTRTASVAEQMGAVNYFTPYMVEDQQAAVPVTLSDNSNIEIGFGRSEGHYLGNSFEGTLGTTEDLHNCIRKLQLCKRWLLCTGWSLDLQM